MRRYAWIDMGPQDPKEVTGQVAHDLTQLASDLAQTKADATNWRVRHAAVEAALIEARRRVRMNEGRG